MSMEALVMAVHPGRGALCLLVHLVSLLYRILCKPVKAAPIPRVAGQIIREVSAHRR